MADIQREIRIELDNIQITLENLDKAMGRGDRDVVELAAIGAFLHNFYSGVERILKKLVGDKVSSSSASWHRDLLQRALDEGIISREASEALFDFLAFRHLFTHGYTFCLDEAKLMVLVKEAKPTFARLRRDLGGSHRRGSACDSDRS